VRLLASRNSQRDPTEIVGVPVVPGCSGCSPHRNALPTDQPRFARPGGVRCDVGAVEADPDDRLFVNGFES
jgi:hypothetical protein